MIILFANFALATLPVTDQTFYDIDEETSTESILDQLPDTQKRRRRKLKRQFLKFKSRFVEYYFINYYHSAFWERIIPRKKELVNFCR